MAIKEGDSGRAVRAIRKGYQAWHDEIGAGRDVDVTDPSYGPALKAEIEGFQAWSDLPVTGQVDGLTAAALARWEIRQAGLQGPPGPRGPEGPQGPPGDSAALPDRETVQIVRG